MGVLVVDDEISVADALEMILRDSGYDVAVALTGRDALVMANSRHFDITITDLRLPDMSGHDVLSYIKEKDPAGIVIIITAYSTPEAVTELKNHGAYEVLSKPFYPSDVLTLINGALRAQLSQNSAEN